MAITPPSYNLPKIVQEQRPQEPTESPKSEKEVQPTNSLPQLTLTEISVDQPEESPKSSHSRRSSRSSEKDHHQTRKLQRLHPSPRSDCEETSRSTSTSPVRNTTGVAPSPRSNKVSSLLTRSSPGLEQLRSNRELSPKSHRTSPSRPGLDLSQISSRDESPKSHRISPSRSSRSSEKDYQLPCLEESPKSHRISPLRSSAKKLPPLELSQMNSNDESVKSSSRKSSRSLRRTHSVNAIFDLNFENLDVPVIPYKLWEEKVLASVENHIAGKDLVDSEIWKIFDNIQNELLIHSSILMRITQAVGWTSGNNKFKFLKNFQTEPNPFQFAKKYNQLNDDSSEMCKFLYDIIGRDDAIEILEKSTSQIIKTKIELKAEMIVTVDNYVQKITSSSFIFKKRYDQNNLHINPFPIHLMVYYEFEENFRSQYSDGPFPENLIQFNGKNLVIPNYNDLGIEEDDRPTYFQKWFISTIQDELGITSSINAESQIEIFRKYSDPSYEGKKNTDKLRAVITKCLSKQFKDHCENDNLLGKISPFLTQLEIKLKEKGLSTNFTEELLPFCDFLRKQLSCNKEFQNKEWDNVALSLIKTYHHIYQLDEKRKSIPTLAMLQGMFFANYSTGEFLLRKTVCPDLFTGTLYPYRLTLNRGSITSYDIIGVGKSFEVKHIKEFKIISGGVTKALITLHWTMMGKLDSIEYESALDMPEFKFTNDCPYEERLFVCNLFHLNTKGSPWGENLEKVEKKKSLYQSIF